MAEEAEIHSRHQQPDRASLITVPIANAIILVLGVLTSIMLARLLGASGRGVVTAWQAWATAISNFSNFGFAQAIVTTQTHGPRLTRSQHAQVLGIVIVNCTVLAVVIIPFVTSGIVPVWTAALFAISNATSTVTPPIFQRLRMMKVHFNLCRLLPAIANLLTIGWLWFNDTSDPFTVMIAISVVQLAVMALISGAVMIRYTSTGPASVDFFTEAVRLAPPRWTLYVFSTADLLVMTLVFPHEEIAFYGVAVSLQTAIVSLGYTVTARWFSHKQSKPLKVPGSYLRELAVLCVTPALAIWVLGHWAIPYFFGPEFGAAVWVSRILAVGGIARALDTLYWYQGLGHVPPRILTWSRLAAIALNVSAVLTAGWFRPPGALELAAAATVVVAGASAAFLIAANRRHLAASQAQG